MANIIQNIIQVLSTAGYRTGDASPGRIMPEISAPVVAVNLEHLDTDKLSMEVSATVVSPVPLGARVCEDEAIKVCRILQDQGAQCEVKPCQLNAKTEHFCVPILAKFQGNVLSDGWKVSDACQVKFGATNLDKIVSFTVWREKEADANSIEEALWCFRVEERMDNIKTEVAPSEPFYMTVTWQDKQERYGECVLTSHKRIIQDGYLLQIREGTAKTRQVTV